MREVFALTVTNSGFLNTVLSTRYNLQNPRRGRNVGTAREGADSRSQFDGFERIFPVVLDWAMISCLDITRVIHGPQ